jgi:phosphoglycolate phosphatase-like HAD superfamily hydrolase
VDLDGTLLRTGAGRRAMLAAVEDVAGRRPADPDRATFTGRTDAWIAAELLRRTGRVPDRESVRLVHRRYLERLDDELCVPGRCEALPGAAALGRALAAQAREGRTREARLLTGNLREGARRKLAAAGLLGTFPLEGAFGDEHEDRGELAATAAAASRDARPVVLGDAPADVAAARAIGARVVLVATGPVVGEALVAARPDVLLPDLADTDAVLAALLG